ncbi:MAG: orotidine-5-phosphate decarboxylase [Acidobacteriaceae bacterium]|jgi:orotidine-5'-phosphate decarboxylase
MQPVDPSRLMNPRERLIVALDVSSAAAARKIVDQVGDSASIYKIGMQLFTAVGPQFVRDLVAAGQRVFLDLKYHDIPNTVASAVADAGRLGVSMLTIHAFGGGKMMRAAAEAARQTNPAMKLLAVTVLTSMDDAELEQVGVQATVLNEVLRLSGLALKEDCGGLVASAQEASAIRSQFGGEFLVVTPGVRPAGAEHGDQARVVTPAQAIAAGASHIVVGRPITAAPDPAAAAQSILEQLDAVALGSKSA